ncbi:MAG: manganese ABC transporter permease [Chloroflexi bacterium RBG_16_68_14]|nr:MAG: manganese ABC transporter permease [Chloroflexi bacterium RBG_16_68_14]
MTEAIDLLRDPWSLEFMRRALLAAMVVSAVAAVIGSFVILKGMAFIGDALPHASFGGVAVAFVLGANLYLGGAIAAVLTAILIGFVSRRGLIKYDTAIGILFVGAFAAGILIISRQNNYTPDLFSFVFGNVLGVSWNDVWTTAALSAVILLLVLLFYKEILFVAYDPSMAAASGLPVAAIQYGLLALIGVTTVIGLQTVGIVLVVALLVTPAATAQLLTRRLPPMMAVGALVGVLSSLVGLYIAYYADVAASAAIVLTATGFFALAFLFAPGRGLLWQRRFAPAERA